MKSQNNANYTWLAIIILILVIVAGVVYAHNYNNSNLNNSSNPNGYGQTTSTSSEAATGTAETTATGTVETATATTVATSTIITVPAENETDWATYGSSTTGVSFEYPVGLSTTYIRTADWPPSIAVTDNQFICTQAGSTDAPAGKTNLVTINGNPYCVTVESEGAAGSVYYQYAYAFPKAGKTMILTFALQYPQCENYDEPKTTECKNEEASLDVNTLGNAMAQSVQYTPVVSPAQPAVPLPTSGVSLNFIAPGSGRVGTVVTLTGTGFASDNKVLFDGDVAASDARLSAVTNGQQSITMTVPSATGPDCKPDEACPMYARLVTPGTYSVVVENTNGTSNVLSFVVIQ